MARKKRDLYQEVTDRILELLSAGTVPWRNPIKRGNGDGWPKNLASGKTYRGINVFLLSTWAQAKGYGSDFWLTFRQAKERDGQVRKGEKSSVVVFWKKYETKDCDTGEDITIPVMRHYNVFNVEQCDGITPPDAPDAPDEDNTRQPFRPHCTGRGNRSRLQVFPDDRTPWKPGLLSTDFGHYPHCST